ncbi:MAG: hypothetical protein HQL30_04385 [Candidatus Omnitrophica bacterium]|nr:hypothetical protein [Candidatus Omnitrophota bacterium]
MGQYYSLAGGGVLTILGVILFFLWGYEVLFIVRGILPGFLIFAGIIALASGTAERKDRKKEAARK